MGRCPFCGQWHLGGSDWPRTEVKCQRCNYRILLVSLPVFKFERRVRK